MAYQCPKCGAWNYPSTRTDYGCECCGYNGTVTITSNGTTDPLKKSNWFSLIKEQKE